MHPQSCGSPVGGDQDQVVGRIADLYMQRRDHLLAAGSKRGVSVSVPTNEDAADVSRAIRERRKARGEIGPDEQLHKAFDQRGQTYDLPIATGDYLRLYRRTWARIDGRGGSIGNNGNVVEVLGYTENGLRLRDKKGRVGEVEWRRMADPKTGRLLLGFGHALTIDAAQGITSDEHIAAFPRGTAGVTAFKAYVAESRARGTTWTIIAEGALHEAERRSRALGDASPVTVADLWERAVADMANKPYKALGMDLAKTARAARDQAVDAFIRQSHRFQTMEAEGRNPGLETRKQVQTRAADRELAGHGTALGGAMRQAGAALQGVGQEVAMRERGQRVRTFVQQQGEKAGAGERQSGEMRWLAQAAVARSTLAPHLAGLDEVLQRNAPSLTELARVIEHDNRSPRSDAETFRHKVEQGPSSSPSPGM